MSLATEPFNQSSYPSAPQREQFSLIKEELLKTAQLFQKQRNERILPSFKTDLPG